MDSVILGLDGLAELENDLKRLSQKEQDQVMRKAVMSGARIIRDEARRRAPVRTRKLKRNIVTQAVKGNNVTAGVTVRTEGKARNPNNAFYWRFQELGTKHQPAKPIFRPAFDAKVEEAADAAGAVLVKGIDKVFMK